MLEAFVHRVRAFADVQNAEEGGMRSECVKTKTIKTPSTSSLTTSSRDGDIS